MQFVSLMEVKFPFLRFQYNLSHEVNTLQWSSRGGWEGGREGVNPSRKLSGPYGAIQIKCGIIDWLPYYYIVAVILYFCKPCSGLAARY